jgi:hypothetical protein
MVQLVVDVVLDDENQEGDTDGEWPFNHIVELLINDMFDSGFILPRTCFVFQLIYILGRFVFNYAIIGTFVMSCTHNPCSYVCFITAFI